MSEFVLIRHRRVLQELHSLHQNWGTGMDGLPGQILRKCARSLCRTAIALMRKMIRQGRWLAMWKRYKFVPLNKKGVVFLATNYNRLHLIFVLSKVAKIIVNIPFCNYLEAINGFGASQWAFNRKRGCMDLVLLLICS